VAEKGTIAAVQRTAERKRVIGRRSSGVRGSAATGRRAGIAHRAIPATVLEQRTGTAFRYNIHAALSDLRVAG
jgi:hypothetical protein